MGVKPQQKIYTTARMMGANKVAMAAVSPQASASGLRLDQKEGRLEGRPRQNRNDFGAIEPVKAPM
jgi:hypothetical protein